MKPLNLKFVSILIDCKWKYPLWLVFSCGSRRSESLWLLSYTKERKATSVEFQVICCEGNATKYTSPRKPAL